MLKINDANKFVRLKNDPSVSGLTTGNFRELPNNRYLIEIMAGNKGLSFYPFDQLELINLEAGIYDDIKAGKFSNPETLKTILIHIQLTGRLADMIYSMESTNTDFYPYQFKPVIKLINSPSHSLLIADEVGLGKTIEAGLIWTELQARFDAKNLIVLCPNALTKKWKDELLNKFDVKADIMKADNLLDFLNSNNNIQRGGAIICAMQSIRPDKGWDDDEVETKREKQKKLANKLFELDSEDAIFDLLIVDEAHHMRNETTQINMLGKLLRNVSEHCVFLSATPIHLKNKDLLSQLSLLDPGQYALNNPSEALRSFEKLIEANRPIIQAREIILNDKNISDAVENIQEAINNDLLSESVGLKNILTTLKNINKNPSVEIRSDLASKLEKSNLLSNIITRTRRRDVNELSIIRRVYPKIIDMSFVEEDFYETVTKAVQKYAEGKKINQKFLLASPQRMMTSSMYGALKHWRKNLSFNLQLDYEDNEDQIPNNNDNDEENYRPLISYLAEETKKFSLNELYSNDTKFNSLRDEILKLNKEFPDEKIVLFSAFKPTLNYLEKRLVDDNLVCFMIHGNTDDRNETLQKFENAEGKAILLSSEVGSEGLDLQFCKILINYDLPWNPMRVEQRIGRIDRVGQSSDYVSILNFINNNTIDQRIWERLYDRLKLCEESLGGFEDILGDEIRKMERGLLDNLTAEEQTKRIIQTEQAISNKRLEHESLEKKASGLIAHGDYILNKVKQSHEFNRWLRPQDLENYLIGFFKEFYPRSNLSKTLNDTNIYNIYIDSQLKDDLREFCRTLRVGLTTQLYQGSTTNVFIGKPSKNSRKKLEIINQQHPLIRFAATKVSNKNDYSKRCIIASEIKSEELIKYLNDKKIKDFPKVEKGFYCFVIQQWSIFGEITNEKLSYIGKNVDTDKLFDVNESELLVKAVMEIGGKTNHSNLDFQKCAEVAKSLFNDLSSRFGSHVQNYKDEVHDKTTVQIKNLKKHKISQIDIFQNTIETHQNNILLTSDDKRKMTLNNLIKAQKGKIEKIEKKVSEKIAYIQKSTNVTEESSDVTAIFAKIQ